MCVSKRTRCHQNVFTHKQKIHFGGSRNVCIGIGFQGCYTCGNASRRIIVIVVPEDQVVCAFGQRQFNAPIAKPRHGLLSLHVLVDQTRRPIRNTPIFLWIRGIVNNNPRIRFSDLRVHRRFGPLPRPPSILGRSACDDFHCSPVCEESVSAPECQSDRLGNVHSW